MTNQKLEMVAWSCPSPAYAHTQTLFELCDLKVIIAPQVFIKFFLCVYERKNGKKYITLPENRELLISKFIILILGDALIGPERPRKSREYSSSQHPYDFEFPLFSESSLFLSLYGS